MNPAISYMKGICSTLILVLGLLMNWAAMGDTQCVTPSLEKLVHYYQKTAVGDAKWFGPADKIIKESTPLIAHTSNPTIVWIGTKFETDTTPFGLLFAVHCDGTIIDGADVGSVRELSIGPVLPGFGETVLSNSVSSGSVTMGIPEAISRSYALFVVQDGKITMVWHHLSFDGRYAWFQQPDDGEETTYRITKIDGKTIEFAATKTTYITPTGKKPSRVHAGDAVKTETGAFTYCWNDSKSTYISCKTDATPNRS